MRNKSVELIWFSSLHSNIMCVHLFVFSINTDFYLKSFTSICNKYCIMKNLHTTQFIFQYYQQGTPKPTKSSCAVIYCKMLMQHIGLNSAQFSRQTLKQISLEIWDYNKQNACILQTILHCNTWDTVVMGKIFLYLLCIRIVSLRRTAPPQVNLPPAHFPRRIDGTKAVHSPFLNTTLSLININECANGLEIHQMKCNH